MEAKFYSTIDGQVHCGYVLIAAIFPMARRGYARFARMMGGSFIA